MQPYQKATGPIIIVELLVVVRAVPHNLIGCSPYRVILLWNGAAGNGSRVVCIELARAILVPLQLGNFNALSNEGLIPASHGKEPRSTSGPGTSSQPCGTAPKLMDRR